MATLTLSPVGRQQFCDLDGNPVSLGKLYTYEAGTLTPLATYTDVDGQVANDNPVQLDAGGWCTLFLLPQSYKYILKDANDALTGFGTQDNISAVAPFDVDVDIAGVAGEDLDANDACYLSQVDGLWYKTDATAAASSSTAGSVALAPAAVLNGEEGSFRLSGRMTGFVALTPGALYYASSTPGAIVTPAPVSPLFSRFVGQADDTGTALVIPTNVSGSASGVALSIPTIWGLS